MALKKPFPASVPIAILDENNRKWPRIQLHLLPCYFAW